MKRRISLLIGLLVMLLCGVVAINAQDEPDPFPDTSKVWVTAQDYLSLRAGPGRGFNRLDVVPPAETVPAYGRTSDTRWVQVEYNGTVGWLATQFLVWSGDIIVLPVDGVNPTPFVRRAAALAVTFRDAPYYSTYITPEDFLGYIPEGTELELTGRVGERGFFRFQARYNDQLVWIGSWDVRVTEGDYRRLLDLAYLYGYGRYVVLLQKNLAESVSSFSQIQRVWIGLSQGQRLACTPIPTRVPHRIAEADVTNERAFLPAVTALNSGIDDLNAAISAFEDACNNPTVPLTREAVITQIVNLDQVERNLILAASLLEPLRRRNPLLGS